MFRICFSSFHSNDDEKCITSLSQSAKYTVAKNKFHASKCRQYKGSPNIWEPDCESKHGWKKGALFPWSHSLPILIQKLCWERKVKELVVAGGTLRYPAHACLLTNEGTKYRIWTSIQNTLSIRKQCAVNQPARFLQHFRWIQKTEERRIDYSIGTKLFSLVKTVFLLGCWVCWLKNGGQGRIKLK